MNSSNSISDCDICGGTNVELIYEAKSEPLARYGLLEPGQNDQSFSNLSQRLLFCLDCRFGWNADFLPRNVSYSSSQIIEDGSFSPRYRDFQAHAASAVQSLIASPLGHALEIGAGSGLFLGNIVAERRTAFEPSSEATVIPEGIEVHNESFNGEKIDDHVDLLVLRQVLEHLQNPLTFLKSAKDSCDTNVGRDFNLYLEVPNAERTFSTGRFYDFYYEHCNYFGVQALSNIANNLGLYVVFSREAMDGELLSVLFRRDKRMSPKSALLSQKFLAHEKEVAERLVGGTHGLILGWGACGNGTVVLNRLGLDKTSIPYVVDSDKNKQGLVIPGTGQKIISPAEAAQLKPNSIVIFSQLHKAEIAAQAREAFGKEVVIMTLD